MASAADVRAQRSGIAEETRSSHPANDTWIAALALHTSARHEPREHFDAVPGLRREAW